MNSRLDKIFLRAALVLGGAALMVSSAMAQDAPPPPMPQAGQNQQGPPPDGRGPRRGGPRPEERLHMLEKQLSLTSEQTTQAKAIFEDERTKMEALHADTATPQQDKRPKMMEIMKDREAKFTAILTADQKSKYTEMEARMREHMQERRPGGDGPPPPQQ